jgi:hypothetical protein
MAGECGLGDGRKCSGMRPSSCQLLHLPHFPQASPNLITSSIDFPPSDSFQFVIMLGNCHIMSPLRQRSRDRRI